ncbi:MAG: S46 family peptidase, partial [Flavobacteriales bacterium]
DEKITAAMFELIRADVAKDLQPGVTATIDKRFKGDAKAWARAVYSSSILADKKRFDAFLAKPTLKALEKDLGMEASESCLNHWRNVIGPAVGASDADIEKGYRLMVAAMREREPGRMWYPNANSTMRLTYGQVGGYIPMDGAFYKHVTTAKGILEKEDPANEEFIVPARQKELLAARDYGRYADESGELVVCFISNNDITGGNSGSPVINGNGELIGIAFDGNWEAMSGDIAFEPDLQRTISVDIRYVLWCIDKVGGAKHLVDEMTLVWPAPKEQPKPLEPAPAPAPVKPAPKAAAKG